MNHDDWDVDEGVVGFTDVMGAPDATGQVGLDPIVRAAHDDLDVLLGVFTDEEVHWTGRDPAAPPDAFIDAPRLATYTPEEQDAALAATIWLLQARGEASYQPDGDELALHGVHAVLADVRNDCEAAISVRLDVPGEGTDRAAVYRVRHDLYLCQDVGREGLHRFTFLAPENQAVWLATTLDPFNTTREDNGPTHTVERLDELSPHPDELAGRCRTSAQLVAAERDDDTPRSLTVYTTDEEGMWFLGGWTLEDTGQVTLANLGTVEAIDVLLAFLSPPRAA